MYAQGKVIDSLPHVICLVRHLGPVCIHVLGITACRYILGEGKDMECKVLGHDTVAKHARAWMAMWGLLGFRYHQRQLALSFVPCALTQTIQAVL